MALTLLIVEDDPAIALALVDFFESERYVVISSSTGEIALEMLDRYHPHLMIADITLPKMDGYELVRNMRMLPAHRLLPIILLTARGQVEDRVRGYQLGCDVYISKPFDLSELSAVVRNLLDRSQMQQFELQVRAQPQEPAARQPNPDDIVLLTERESQVLDLLCHGLSNRHMGLKLNLSPRTVEKYVSRLLQRTDTSNRADLVRYAMEHQLVERRSPSSSDWRSEDPV
jgi:DNA-binding NarL/FixJ family response regulator